MKKVLYDTRLTIIEKLEVEEDIKVKLRESYNEFAILTAMPIVVDLFMKSDSAMSASGQTAVGVIARLIAVVLCMVSYKISKGIIHRVEKVFD